MTFLDRPLADLLSAFSDPTPTPGGGSASALAAALGLSLVAMVAQMGRTRAGSDEDRAALDQAKAALLPLRDHVSALVEDDSKAYDAVVAAYRLPKATDEEKATQKGGRAKRAARRGRGAARRDARLPGRAHRRHRRRAPRQPVCRAATSASRWNC